MPYTDIMYTVGDGIATITLNRPQALNAETSTMLRGWMEALRQSQDDPAVKAVVVTGAGRAFCAGADLNPSRTASDSVATGLGPEESAFPECVQALEKPYLAAVNGAAVGGGMDLVSWCDIRIASEKARFGMVFVRLGAIPAVGGLYTLPRIVGTARALELIWSGRVFDAPEALAIGYVSQVVPPDQLLPVTYELAARIARGPSLAIREAKRLVYRGLGQGMTEALLEERAAWTEKIGPSEDHREGIRAWREKREPVFGGQ